MKSTFLLIAAAMLLTACANQQPLVRGGKIDRELLDEHCYAADDAKHNHIRYKRKLDQAELELARMQAKILRGDKRSALAKAMAAHGLQSDKLGALGWAEGMLGNQDIEQQASNEVWLVELRQAKERYDAINEFYEEADELQTRALNQMRAAGILHADCRKAGYW